MAKILELITGDYFKAIKLVIDLTFLGLGVFIFLRMDLALSELHRLNRTSWELYMIAKETPLPQPVIKHEVHHSKPKHSGKKR